MSTGRTASAINPTLTNYAQGFAQDRKSALAEFMAPTVRVAASMGQYKAFNVKNAFMIYDTARALGGPATRIKFEATDPTYNAKPNALEIPIDDAERLAAGESDPLGLEQAKIETLITDATLAHENKVVAAFKAGVSAESGKGVWSVPANDPAKELDDLIQAIAVDTGMMPNAIVFGLGAWNVFRNHAKIIARQPGAAIIGLSVGQAGSMLLNPGIEIRVGIMSKDTTLWGKTSSKANVVGDEVFVFLRSASPTVYDPGCAKTFTCGSGGITSVRMYRDESAHSDIYSLDWSEDVKIVSTVCVKRLTIT